MGIGNALVDVLIRMDDDHYLDEFSLPKGSMTLIDDTKVRLIHNKTDHLQKDLASGGSASNTISGLANLGVSCGYIGKIGEDQFGEIFRVDLEELGVNPCLLYSKTSTGIATTLVSKDGERTFGTYLGAAIELATEDLKPSHFTGYDILHIEGYLVVDHDLILRALILAKENGLEVSMDMASYNVVEANLEYLKPIVTDYVDILFANEDEAHAFTGKAPVQALHEIAEIVDIAVVKTGEKGSLVKTAGNVYKIPPVSSKCLDTTGAGDLYASGFLYGLANNLLPEQCGRLGSLLGGYVIQIYGARMDEVQWDKIKEKIKEITG